MYIDEVFPLAVRFRRHFHRYPEFAMEEYGTQKYITEVLEEYGISYTTHGTGVIAVLGEGEPCVALRADMDALKVKEETGLPFCSENEGMMHACGHDMHLAMVLAAAIVLKQEEERIEGTVKFVFQPSEEKRPGGARLLLSEVLRYPVPRAIFAQHISPDLPVGTVGVRSGAFFASSDNLICSIEGRGTHAAMPQCGSDPILAAAVLVQFYQSLMTKFKSPQTSAVLSVTSIHGGTCNNVIPNRVDLLGTIRTHDNELRNSIFEWIDTKSKAICELYGCTFTLDKTDNGLPVLMNDSALADKVIANAASLVGRERVLHIEPLMLGEDFAIYLQQLPGVMWLLGVRPPEQSSMPPLHNPKMSPAEEAMRTGICLLVDCVRHELVLHK